ncbi:MAG: SixA phosphatase family protein [Thermodesulfobacteriota bacterium]
MAKKIILYRHGKSDWSAAYGSDHERPLAKKGVNSAKIMGRLLGSSNQIPELAITSTALRAKQTLEISILEGGWECEVKENKDLYYSGPDEILEIIRNIPNNYSSVILVGHEPKWTTLCTRMIGGGEVVFSTASMARIDYDVDNWNAVEYGFGELKWLQQPSFFSKGKFDFKE